MSSLELWFCTAEIVALWRGRSEADGRLVAHVCERIGLPEVRVWEVGAAGREDAVGWLVSAAVRGSMWMGIWVGLGEPEWDPIGSWRVLPERLRGASAAGEWRDGVMVGRFWGLEYDDVEVASCGEQRGVGPAAEDGGDGVCGLGVELVEEGLVNQGLA